MEFFLTPGAERVLALADRLALAARSPSADVEHLLWALVLDESQAAEMIAAHGITREILTRTFPGLADDVPPAASTRESVDRSELLRLALVEARRFSAISGTGAEVGTGHLLCGLAFIPSPVSELLQAHHLAPDAAVEALADRRGDSGAPLATDITIAPTPKTETGSLDALRIIDAAANRCREGVRVVEDFARFTLDDRHLTELLKSWRHEFSDACRLIDSQALLAARDTRDDVGTEIHTSQERSRESPRKVAQAAWKRVQEAARTLEEFGKIVSAEFAERIGALRYRAYTLEKAVLTADAALTRLADCRLYLLLSQELCPGGAGPVVRAALAAGVRIVQVREKKLADRELLDWSRRVREWTAEAGALFIMNDRPDLAVLAGADGVHVGQDELSVRDARRIVGPGRLVGVSTHSIDQARAAVLDGADYIGVGPVFASTTKSFRDLAGIPFVQQVAAEIALPAFAIGGISLNNIQQAISAGARRVAVSGAICGADDPGQAVRALLEALEFNL